MGGYFGLWSATVDRARAVTFAGAVLAMLVPAAPVSSLAQDVLPDDSMEAVVDEFTPNGLAAEADPLSVEILARADELTHEYRMAQERNRLIECLMLVLAAVAGQIIILRCLGKGLGWTANQVINATGLIYIVFGTIVIVILTDAETQLTAPMGIMGAVAGYLFGTMRKDLHGGETPSEATGQGPADG